MTMPQPMHAYYWTMQRLYRLVFRSQQMIHYPLFVAPGQSLIEGQRHLSDRVVATIAPLRGLDVLEIGCGNGEQALYLAERNAPRSYRAIDLYPPHIAHARHEAVRRHSVVEARVDDAQVLATVSNASVDRVLCIESAHHYPDKPAFLRQVRRVLRHGGRFVIAELTSRSGDIGMFEKMTQTYCWTEAQWLAEIAETGLACDATEDVTKGLSAGLEEAARGLPAGAGVASRAAHALGRRLIRHYVEELRGDRRYHLFVGHAP